MRVTRYRNGKDTETENSHVYLSDKKYNRGNRTLLFVLQRKFMSVFVHLLFNRNISGINFSTCYQPVHIAVLTYVKEDFSRPSIESKEPPCCAEQVSR